MLAGCDRVLDTDGVMVLTMANLFCKRLDE
jgi:hypothetical protein